jgi:DNA-directed RNA polymerase subunit M/transcription elongation factor TFIIS
MNNACPECGAIYAVAEKDIGRRIACKKCNAALIVTEKGLEQDGSDAAPSKREDAPERDRGRDRDDGGRRRRSRNDDVEDRPRKQRGPGAGEILNKLKGIADVATWLYGIGLFLTIYSYYTRTLDIANVYSRIGDQEFAEIEDAADERDVNSKNEGKPSEDDKKAREKRKKEYDKKLPVLKEDVRSAQASYLKAQWRNTYLRIIGLALLAFGSIGYLIGEHAQTKRILGAVTIGFVLLAVVGGGANFHLQTGGPDLPMPPSKAGLP